MSIEFTFIREIYQHEFSNGCHKSLRNDQLQIKGRTLEKFDYMPLMFTIIAGEDFKSETDLRVACTILQRQIEHIHGNRENIVIPSVRMRQLRGIRMRILFFYFLCCLI